MRTINTLFFLIFFMIAASAVEAQNWQLVWQDEFTNGISPDWVFETGRGSSGWGNNELQYYRSENATVENGQLIITARRQDFGTAHYTSARMKTQGRKSFKYGKIEARIALPTGQGLWPAFWMLGNNISSVGWPACGEIDILEHVNTSPDVHGTIHWEDHNGDHANYGGHTAVNVNNYHLYTIEWDENTIKWFVDGNQFHEVNISNGVNGTSEFHNEYFLLLNLAVGGNWPGFTVDESRLPARMSVDYVRVYRDDDNGTPNQDQLIEAENYASMSGVEKENCSEGGQNVGYIDTGDWMAYTNINFPTSGNYLIEYRVASAVGGGTLSADLNAGATVLGQVNIPNTGGWQNWTTVSHTVNINAGTHDFGMYAVAGGWNINWIKITSLNSATRTTQLASKKLIKSSFEQKVQLFPIPATNELNLRGANKGSNISIVNLYGQLVKTIKIDASDSDTRIDISALKSGAYFIKMKNDMSSKVIKFIKK
ncbi:carbohydrate-binding protein [Flavivirga sp. 57AJ16]|uniref:carbohydrate-binding protein n=1 Tax=Flavivirga sp. 57AJ16 TaxID=3025307 RepID=UPI0023664DEE|nr:carbohydrate-binding protein [Flavivirga sp. 57AJ16]MDD7886345.1 carbohydrate-binding protein [Flavivirga sp. 57AJ16]